VTRRRQAACLVLLLVLAVASADWETALDYGDDEDHAAAVLTSSTGFMYAVATCAGESDFDIVVFKVSPNGNVAADTWYYDSGDDDYFVDAALDETGSALYVSTSVGLDTADLDGFHTVENQGRWGC